MRPPNTRVEEYVLKNWKRQTVTMMASELKTSVNVVRNICDKLVISPITSKDLKIALVLDNPKLSTNELATLLGCTIQYVSNLKREIESGDAFRDSKKEIKEYLISRQTVELPPTPVRSFKITFSRKDYLVATTNKHL
jgi:hypothetical protein